MLVHSLASKYARFVVIVRQMYWTPPPSDHWTPPLLKSDDLFLGNQEILDPPLSKILDTPLTYVKLLSIFAVLLNILGPIENITYHLY